MGQTDLFNSLASNGFNFLETAVNEIQEKPKYSVIHFHSAIEILFKARLLLEHWALTWASPENANIDKFLAGDFRSVSLEESIDRLKNVSKIRIPSSSFDAFKNLQEHRNQMVHFFHPDYQDEPTDEAVTSVVADLCVAWLHLHQLLARSWSEQFTDYEENIDQLHQKMLLLRPYLSVRFDNLEEDIEKGKERGVTFEICRSCGYESARVIKQDHVLLETDCLVCENQESKLRVECPDCGKSIEIFELGQGTCATCGYQIDMDYLIEEFGAGQSIYEEYEDPAHGYCPNCEWIEHASVVPWNDRYICLNCFFEYDYLSRCEWCNEKNAGDMAGSFLHGCVLCEGRDGWGD